MKKKDKWIQNPKDILVENLDSVYAQAYQRIQTNIDLSSINRRMKVFAITSPSCGEGKTTTACNLANIWAYKGKKVLLIDLDLYRNNIHRVFGLENRIGIVDYCTNEATFKDILKHYHALDILTAGKKTIFPELIVGSNILAKLIKKCRSKYDYIILDTPPLLMVNDSLLLKNCIDGILCVVSIGMTKKKELEKTIHILKESEIKILGIVATHDVLRKSYDTYYAYSDKEKAMRHKKNEKVKL